MPRDEHGIPILIGPGTTLKQYNDYERAATLAESVRVYEKLLREAREQEAAKAAKDT